MNKSTNGDASFDDYLAFPFRLQSAEEEGEIIEFPVVSESSKAEDDSEIVLQKLLRQAKTISEERERFLLKAVQSGDAQAKEELIKHFMPMLNGESVGFVRSGTVGCEHCDLVQLAAMVFLRVVEKFNPNRGHRLSSYASRCIHRLLRRHVRKCTVNVSSLDEPLPGSDGQTPGDQLLAPETTYDVTQHAEATECSLLVKRAKQNLTPGQRDVLELHLEKGLTFEQVGARLGVSAQGCSQREKRALRTLQRVFAAMLKEQYDDWRRLWS